MPKARQDEAVAPHAAHRDSQWVVAALGTAPLALALALVAPPLGGIAAFLSLVLAVVAMRTRTTRRRGPLTAALVVSGASLVWSLLVVLYPMSVSP